MRNRLLALAALAALYIGVAVIAAAPAHGGAWEAVYKKGQAYGATTPRGYAIVALKRELAYRGHGKALVFTLPSFGSAMHNRTREFQRAHALPATGQINPATARVLFRLREHRLEGRYAIPGDYLCKLTELESAHDPGAVGTVDAADRGLNQINARAHPDVSNAEAFDPRFSLVWTADRLRDGFVRFGDWQVAVAAHNVGFGGASTWQRQGKPADTTAGRYVRLVESRVCASVLGVSSVNTAGELAPLSVCPRTSRTQLLCLHNYARRANGLPRLRIREPDGRLNPLYRSASLKADRLIVCREFTHYPCGDPADRQMREAGIAVDQRWWGENLAFGFTTIRDAFQAWLGSPGHRANVLHPQFRWFGSALRLDASGMCGGCSHLWVTHFAS